MGLAPEGDAEDDHAGEGNNAARNNKAEGADDLSNITVTILGCSGTYAEAGGACTGYLVQSEGANVLLDAGPGVVAQLQQHIALEELTAVVTTHCHPDHWAELPVLRNALQYCLGIRGVQTYGTAETETLFKAIVGAHGTDELGPAMPWTTITTGSTFTIADQRWSFLRTDHPVETLAPRVDVGDKSFVFSSDTGPDVDFAEFGPGIDLFLCEASLSVEDEGLAPHVSGREAGLLAKAAEAQRLVLTHFVPRVDVEAHREAAEIAYGARVEVAEIGAAFVI